LTEVHLPNSLTYDSDDNFYECTALARLRQPGVCVHPFFRWRIDFRGCNRRNSRAVHAHGCGLHWSAHMYKDTAGKPDVLILQNGSIWTAPHRTARRLS